MYKCERWNERQREGGKKRERVKGRGAIKNES